MDAEEPSARTRQNPRDALQIALAGYLAAQQLDAESLGCFYGSALPSLVLWVNSWHPLPDLITWLAVLGWGVLALLAVNLAVIATKRRSRAAAALPDANRIARVRFAPSGGLPPSSTLLFGISAITSSLLWVHGLAPQVLGPDVAPVAGRVWIVLFVGAVGSRFLESSS